MDFARLPYANLVSCSLFEGAFDNIAELPHFTKYFNAALCARTNACLYLLVGLLTACISTIVTLRL